MNRRVKRILLITGLLLFQAEPWNVQPAEAADLDCEDELITWVGTTLLTAVAFSEAGATGGIMIPLALYALYENANDFAELQACAIEAGWFEDYVCVSTFCSGDFDWRSGGEAS